MDRNYGKQKGKDSYFRIPLSNSSESFKKQWSSLNAYEKHKKLIDDYKNIYQKSISPLQQQSVTSEIDILKKNHQFLRDDEDEPDSWEGRLAKKYYDKLYKEYCLVDLSKSDQGKVAMRWRTEREVIGGKGHFTCGNLSCDSSNDLKSWEVPFGYTESKVKKLALVKLRLCRSCSQKLNYKHESKAENVGLKRKQKDEMEECISDLFK